MTNKLPVYRKTIYYVAEDQKLYGPKQTFSSLYKEFIVDGKVHCFYLHQANQDAFVYKLLRRRPIEPLDRNLKTLLKSV